MMKNMEAAAAAFWAGNGLNRVSGEVALRPDLVGMQIYDMPIFAVGAADDPMFAELRKPEAVHPEYMLPEDWIPGARSVVSFFLPYTKQVVEANTKDLRIPADEWLHGRFEGEMAARSLREFVRDWFIQQGYEATAPMHDARNRMLADYAPCWSERHTGFICGLGTFGMSKGLITEVGVAGRLGSVITDCPLPVTPRKYTDRYAYCSQCGQCAAHCPVQCIDPARGMDLAKAHPACDRFLKWTMEKSEKETGVRRYGCGKCQSGVPCSAGIAR